MTYRGGKGGRLDVRALRNQAKILSRFCQYIVESTGRYPTASNMTAVNVIPALGMALQILTAPPPQGTLQSGN